MIFSLGQVDIKVVSPISILKKREKGALKTGIVGRSSKDFPCGLHLEKFPGEDSMAYAESLSGAKGTV